MSLLLVTGAVEAARAADEGDKLLDGMSIVGNDEAPKSLVIVPWKASPREASQLREVLGPDALIVTPGVRPKGSAAGDQRRVATPTSAVASGADLVVVGRPIRDAKDPANAARAIVEEIAAGLESR